MYTYIYIEQQFLFEGSLGGRERLSYCFSQLNDTAITKNYNIYTYLFIFTSVMKNCNGFRSLDFMNT